MSILHALLRGLYLAGCIAVLPASFLYLKMEHASYLKGQPNLIMVGVVCGGLFWALFFLVLGQRYFPFSLKGAFITILLFFSNFFLASNLAEWNFSFGAYSLLLTTLSGQIIYFAFLTTVFFHPRLGKKYFHYHELKGYFSLPLFALLSIMTLFLAMQKPFFEELFSAPRLIEAVVYFGIYLTEVVVEIQRLLQANLFQFDRKFREERDRILENWSVPIVLGFVGSILATLIIGVFTG